MGVYLKVDVDVNEDVDMDLDVDIHVCVDVREQVYLIHLVRFNIKIKSGKKEYANFSLIFERICFK